MCRATYFNAPPAKASTQAPAEELPCHCYGPRVAWDEEPAVQFPPKCCDAARRGLRTRVSPFAWRARLAFCPARPCGSESRRGAGGRAGLRRSPLAPSPGFLRKGGGGARSTASWVASSSQGRHQGRPDGQRVPAGSVGYRGCAPRPRNDGGRHLWSLASSGFLNSFWIPELVSDEGPTDTFHLLTLFTHLLHLGGERNSLPVMPPRCGVLAYDSREGGGGSASRSISVGRDRDGLGWLSLTVDMTE